MTAITTVTIGRPELSLADLVIDSDGFSTYMIDFGGLGRPGRLPRATLATASPFVNGQTRTAVVWDESTLPLTVRVQAASSAALDTAVTALEAALSQFIYPVEVEVDGVAKTYTAYPATWNTTDALIAFDRVAGHYEDLAITIPIHPVAS